jgi:hypothetical protein
MRRRRRHHRRRVRPMVPRCRSPASNVGLYRAARRAVEAGTGGLDRRDDPHHLGVNDHLGSIILLFDDTICHPD